MWGGLCLLFKSTLCTAFREVPGHWQWGRPLGSHAVEQCQSHAVIPMLTMEGYFQNQSPFKTQWGSTEWRDKPEWWDSMAAQNFKTVLSLLWVLAVCPGFTQQSVSLVFASSKCQSKHRKFCVLCEKTKTQTTQLEIQAKEMNGKSPSWDTSATGQTQIEWLCH